MTLTFYSYVFIYGNESVTSQLYFYYSKVMFTLLSTVSELYCAYCASVYFISFSHGYSAILAAKLMIKLKLDLNLALCVMCKLMRISSYNSTDVSCAYSEKY